jgi:hypothetical protein
MNERIVELIIETVEELIAETKESGKEHIPDTWNIPDEFCEKFSKLIIKECCQLVEDTSGVSLNDIESIKENIQQNFGIK